MLTDPSPDKNSRDGLDGGYTLVELVFVLMIMAVVLVAAGTALISLSSATNRDSGLVTEEQSASGAITQMVHDLRSAHSISIPTGATYTNQVLINDNTTSGTTTQVEWTYVPSTGTLTRYVQGSGGTLVASGTAVTGVANSGAQPLLSYYDFNGGTITNTDNIANCTTRVGVDLVVSAPTSAGTGVANQEFTQNVAITDQLAILSQPGNVQC